MNETIQIEEKIQSFIDGTCTEEESAEIREKITSDKRWEEYYHTLLSVHELLAQNMETMEPSMRFTKNVMEEIQGLSIARPVRLRSNPWIFRLAGGTLAMFLVFILGYAISQFDFQSSAEMTKLPIPEFTLPNLSWEKYLNSGASILLFMVCTILAFVIADKYFQQKRKQTRHGGI